MNKKKIEKLIPILILIILLSAFLIYFFNDAKIKYSRWNEHKSYLTQNKDNLEIKSWMSINFIKRKFDIDMEKELGIKLSFFDKKLTLEEIAKKEDINITPILENLNSKIKEENN